VIAKLAVRLHESQLDRLRELAVLAGRGDGRGLGLSWLVRRCVDLALPILERERPAT
jgi:hypothetical protein